MDSKDVAAGPQPWLNSRSHSLYKFEGEGSCTRSEVTHTYAPLWSGGWLFHLDDVHGEYLPSSKTDISVHICPVPQEGQDGVGVVSENDIALHGRGGVTGLLGEEQALTLSYSSMMM